MHVTLAAKVVTDASLQSPTPQQAFERALQLQQAGKLLEAEGAYQQVLSLDPANVAALNNLGNLLLVRGRAAEAAPHYRRVLELAPGLAVAHGHLGKALFAIGSFDEAERCYRKACELDPALAEPHADLARLLWRTGRVEQAEPLMRRAVALSPANAEFHNRLGVIAALLGRKEELVQHFRRALDLDPDLAEAHGNLGNALMTLGRLEEAEPTLRRALTLDPGLASAHLNLANVMFSAGRLEEAEAGFRRAAALDPADREALSSLAFVLNYVPGKSAAEIFAAHREYALCLPARAAPGSHGNSRDPGRRLRIGYVSADFRNHSVAIFFEPVLAAHDRQGFEIFCYYNFPDADAVTARLKSLADGWSDVFRLEDDRLASLIRDDAIDILVDLGGHSMHNRLPVFARKPAPLQATWLGYTNTTGLDAIDYRVADACLAPEGALDALHSEKILRLPECTACYRPPAGSPDVSPPPSASSGSVTFAAFTNLSKVAEPMIELWSRLLMRVPGSRLLVVSAVRDAVPAGYADRFARYGISRERLEVLGRQPMYAYLALHQRVDLVLDTWPFSAGTTTCHALWMGVPVVALVGETATSRCSSTYLHAVGLDELVAYSPDQYAAIAERLAKDQRRLAELRSGMRARMAASPLMDEKRFTLHLENAYRDMWRAWCENPKP